MEWEGILAVEGTPTGDGRLIRAGALDWRDLPLTLMGQFATDEGHDGARVVGRIDSIERVGAEIRGRGIFTDSEDGREAARLAAEGSLTGISIDLAVGEVELMPMPEPEEQTDPDDEPSDEPIRIEVDVVEVEVTRGTIMGATVTPFPAFAEATITSVEGAPEAIVAAVQAPGAPPAEWFTDPELTAPTPLTITPEGRVYGHVAAWGTCHVGIPGSCVEPPTSATGYAQFLLGEVETADGSRVPVGQLTLDTTHADLSASRAETRRHYEVTGTAVADVTAGEDEWGIYVAGALRPSVTEAQVRELMAAKPSGDWRAFGGNLELVGILAVNVPGYPVPRARVASATATEPEHGLALVAAGALPLATKVARAQGRMRRVRGVPLSITAAGRVSMVDPDDEQQLAALADRVFAPRLEALAERTLLPELERLARRL